jgi:hypothetical protein
MKETEKDTKQRFLGLQADGGKETMKETAKEPRAGL